MTTLETHKLASLKSIAGNLSSLTYEELKNIVGHLVPTFPISTQLYEQIRRPKEGTFERDPTILYRARPNEIIAKGSSGKMPFQKVEDIAIVPLAKKKNIHAGRCNLPENRIFYCSNVLQTACTESASQGFTKDIRNIELTLGVWQINQPLYLAEMAFSKATLQELERATSFSYDRINKYNMSWYNHIKSDIEKNMNRYYSPDFALALLDFFSDEFGKMKIKKASDYNISNLYCDVILNHSNADDNGALYDGILYPSVRNALQEFNIALHPRAMPKLEFICAELIWMTRGNDKKIHFNTLERAFADSDGNLNWNIFKVNERDIIWPK